MHDFYDLCNDTTEYFTAPHFVGCPRPPGTHSSRRFRRRGPQSHDALFRRQRRLDIDVSPVLPQGGGSCQSGRDPSLSNDDVTIFHCNLRGFITNRPVLVVLLRIIDKRPSNICLTEIELN